MGECVVCGIYTDEFIQPKTVCPCCREFLLQTEELLDIAQEAYSRGKRDGAEQTLILLKGEHNDND